MGKEVRLILPEPHPKQLLTFNSLANEQLYGGATRGGKSFYGRWAPINWCIHVPGLQCDIFRLNFDDVIADCMDGMHSFPEMLAPLEREGLVKINQTEISFWNHSLISLEHASNFEKVKLKHQGIGKQVRIFIEATQIETALLKWLRAWMTVPEEMKATLPDCLRPLYPQFTDEQLREFFPKILYLTNPIGQSATYFRKHFVKARPKYEIGRAPDSDGGFLRQYIPALVEDNKSEDAQATRRRVSGMGDEAVSDALLNENWDAPVGEYFSMFDDNLHVIKRFHPPAHWFKYRTFDWGTADPAACYWWCVSDGVEFKDHEGRKRWYPAGSLIAYREWYICDEVNNAKGLDLSNDEMAEGIRERTLEPMSFEPVITDSKPFQGHGEKKEGKKYKIADRFAECGVPLIQGNCARVQGWSQLKDRLIGIKIGIDQWPLFYLMEECRFLREYLPALPRSKTNFEDAAEDGEATHCCDCARLAATTRPLVIQPPKPEEDRFKKESLTPAKILLRIQQNQGSTQIGRR